jgi:transposase InsO family protein
MTFCTAWRVCSSNMAHPITSGPTTGPSSRPRRYGYNESFNGKLRDELLNTEIFYTLMEARVLIERWRQH